MEYPTVLKPYHHLTRLIPHGNYLVAGDIKVTLVHLELYHYSRHGYAAWLVRDRPAHLL